jgi:hypothetical protein
MVRDSRMTEAGMRVLWFRDRLEPGKPVYTTAEVCAMVEDYIKVFFL